MMSREHRAESVLRIGGVASIPSVLRGLGCDPREVLGEAGIDPALFDDPENRIPFARLGELLAFCVARTGCKHFGLLVGQGGGASSLGLVGFLALHSPDVESALRTLVRYLHHHDRGAVPTLAIVEGSAALGYAIYQPRIAASEQIVDGALAVGCNIMRRLCGREWQASEVLFAHRAPQEIAPFRRFFRSPLRFDAEQNALVFSSEWLRKPLSGADPELHRLLQKQIDTLEARYGGDFPHQVQRVLHGAVLTGRAVAPEVAALFSMHSRTLNRRLQAAGSSFRQLADASRYEIARQMLEDSAMTVSEIAAALNYADASAFSRAFARWSGKPPRRWRAERQIGAMSGR
ncbi:MAG TPA: AraC family transcriptional regulator [Accumulibacter sp.]|uniref:AraC family transcriptional regulator n=1 Tax=Accumulibacter sp. TaxID=2053492 RepID=UPI0025D23852|nr:AraC family transcriptional regulator [Accumulibacter sp.]MCM8599592.1 AraC family transcriptional regulator [Accumulibacter sp.]MCM8663467.1 AraC family transcriptional regulator [Accumulibacter sp.]HNC51015.1 AraC family transcriptional regulator [Accumulibacter sp.]